MGQGRNKVILVVPEKYDTAVETLGTIHEQLYSQTATRYHSNIFVPPGKVQLTSRQNDTISACNYSSFADDLLPTYQSYTINNNSSFKRPRMVHLSYSAAVSTVSTPQSVQHTTTTNAPSTISSLMDRDMDALFERMKPYFDNHSTSGITIDELDHKLQQSQEEVLSFENNLHSSITDLSTRFESLTSKMERQNSIILGMEGQFKETFHEFSIRIKELYDYIKQSFTPPTASTSKHVQWGSSVK
jgi:hypothetical protein